jgi:hypothetical protein
MAAPPTSPIALTPANLAVLQQRQPQLPARQDAAGADGDARDARPAPAPGSSGRGRLVDILA